MSAILHAALKQCDRARETFREIVLLSLLGKITEHETLALIAAGETWAKTAAKAAALETVADYVEARRGATTEVAPN